MKYLYGVGRPLAYFERVQYQTTSDFDRLFDHVLLSNTPSDPNGAPRAPSTHPLLIRNPLVPLPQAGFVPVQYCTRTRPRKLCAGDQCRPRNNLEHNRSVIDPTKRLLLLQTFRKNRATVDPSFRRTKYPYRIPLSYCNPKMSHSTLTADRLDVTAPTARLGR